MIQATLKTIAGVITTCAAAIAVFQFSKTQLTDEVPAPAPTVVPTQTTATEPQVQPTRTPNTPEDKVLKLVATLACADALNAVSLSSTQMAADQTSHGFEALTLSGVFSLTTAQGTSELLNLFGSGKGPAHEADAIASFVTALKTQAQEKDISC